MEKFIPKWVYHKTQAPKVVHTQQEFDALEKGWEETPAAFGEKSHETEGEQIEDQAAEKQNEALKNKDFLKMKVAELRAVLLEKGVAEEKLEGLKKDELIALIGAL